MLTPGRIYKADKCWNLSFDGTGDYVSTGLTSEVKSISAISVLFWMRPVTLINKHIFGNYTASPNHNGFFTVFSITSNVLRAHFVVGGVFHYADVGSFATTDTWLHFAQIFNGAGADNAARLKIYKDGETASPSYTGTIPSTTPAIGSTLHFGLAGSSLSGSDYRGRMANISIWSRALSQKEIQYYMNRYLTGREDGLIACYPFLDTTGTTLKDWSNNKKSGTITNATWVKGS